MRLGILGPLEVVGEDGTRREPAASRLRRLLLALLVWRDEPVSVDRLVDVVWADTALPRDPVAALRTYLTRVRSVLEAGGDGQAPVVGGGPQHYTLRLNGHELDATSFERDLADGAGALTEDPAAALRSLDRGLARWRGPALLEVADEHWAMPEAVRLEELRLTAVEHRLSCLIELGSHLEALGDLERLIRKHPLRERPHGLLMLALDRAGRGAEAADVFREFRQRLAEETGLEPSEDLQRLHTRLLGFSAAATFADSGAVGVWNELPTPRTTLIGRDGEVLAVTDLISTHRLVTVTGVGGVGKTRLALALAHKDRDDGGSVAFADLGRVSDPAEVADAVFAALRMPAYARGDGLDGLLRVLGARPGLLIVDNCEHVIDAVAVLIDRALEDCPTLTVLATSREPIGVEGECVYRLPSLAPPAGSALFRERAAAVRDPAPADRQLVEDICQRLDGIPLAIELAAARTAHMGLSEIADRLDERFRLLTGGRRALARQQTLEAAIDWSYGLLDEDEQAVLRAAAVFTDGFDVAGLAAVAGHSDEATLDVLASLVSKSLVELDSGEGPARYRLLETLRLYGLERLREAGELGERRERHARHFLDRALAHGPRINDLPAGGGPRTMCRLRMRPMARADEEDLANHVAALDWLDRDGDLRALGRLAARLITVMDYQGFSDPTRRYLGRGDVIDAEDDAEEQALYLVASALHATFFGNFAEELRFARQAMQVATEPVMQALATALTVQASLAFDREQVPELVHRALRELPADAHYARLLVRGQETLYLLFTDSLTAAAERLDAHARAGDIFAASELMLVLHVLGDDAAAVRVPVPDGGEPEHERLWAYRCPLARAFATSADDQHAAAGHLLEAGEMIRSSPVKLLDTDVLLGCAAVAYHQGEHARARQLLAVVGRNFRSPASYLLARRYRDLVDPELSDEQRATIDAVATGLRPADVLDQELERLRATAPA